MRIQLIVIFLSIAVLPGVSHAYIDPGAGSYFFQIMIAAGLGIIYSSRVYARATYDYVMAKLGRPTTIPERNSSHGADSSDTNG